MSSQDWRRILNDAITTPQQLSRHFSMECDSLATVCSLYPMRINSYYLGLIREPGDPLWRQAVPSLAECQDQVCMEDPLDEENLSPVPNLIHKYPDRVLFLVHSQCAMYCRFCTRKRKVGTAGMVISERTVAEGIRYIRDTPAIKDVLISGGDPLLLEDERLEEIVASLRAIRHVEIIRIGSRVPCTLPMRVTEELCTMLKRYHPIYINTHFNHPDEITPQAARACSLLADAGIVLGCQTVLLRKVNDSPQVIEQLMRALLRIRVRPYYLFQGDMTRGTDHFRTPVHKGMDIMRSLIGHISGMALPIFALDAPGGGGKIPLMPDYVKKHGQEMVFTNYCGTICRYTDGYY